jgi:uncharacterized membrane-anchored protein YitT (DUF2179 family)
LARLWSEVRRSILMTIGVLLAALGYSLFQVPYHIAAGGIGGLSIIINHFTGWPPGTLYFIMNVPLLVLGFFYLGRWPFIIRTIVSVIIFSAATDIFVVYLPGLLPTYPLTQDWSAESGVAWSTGPAALLAARGLLAGLFNRRPVRRLARFTFTPTG